MLSRFSVWACMILTISDPNSSGILFPLKSRVWHVSQVVKACSRSCKTSSVNWDLVIANVSRWTALPIVSVILFHVSLLKYIPHICKVRSRLFFAKLGLRPTTSGPLKLIFCENGFRDKDIFCPFLLLFLGQITFFSLLASR